MIKNKNANANDFYKVSLTNAEHRNYLFWSLLAFSFCTFFPVVWLMSDIQNKIVFSGGSSVIANIIAVLIFALYVFMLATVYKGNIIKNLIMDCQSYTKYRPNETTGGIFVSWRRKEELPTGA